MCQLEAGFDATSYIPTTTARVIRSADVCSISGANFVNLYNPLEGTMFISMSRNTNAGTATNLSINNNNGQNRADILSYNQIADIRYTTTSPVFTAYRQIPSGDIPAGEPYKVAYAIGGGVHASSCGGSLKITNTATLLASADKMNIGSSFDYKLGGSIVISSVRYYRRRLPNAKLQALTI
jgi:hypothetical protein